MDASYPNLDPGVLHPEARTVSPEVIETLRRTKGWTRFLAVLGFVSCGFMVLAGLFMMAGSLVGGMRGAVAASPLVVMGLFYVIGAVVAIAPSVMLWRYASRIGVVVQTQTELDLVAALDAQRSYWKLIGIFAIVMLAIYLLGIISFVIMAATGNLVPTPAMLGS